MLAKYIYFSLVNLSFAMESQSRAKRGKGKRYLFFSTNSIYRVLTIKHCAMLFLFLFFYNL